MIAINKMEHDSNGIMVNLAINGTPMTMTLDTGASISVITQKSYKANLPNLKLHKSEVLLKTYTGEPLKVYMVRLKLE